MKLYQLVLVFLIICLVTIVYIDIKTAVLIEHHEHIEQIERGIRTAIDDSIENLSFVGKNNQILIDKEKAVNSFFLSLYSSFGIILDKEKREALNHYIPLIIITTEDGLYVFYSDEYIGSDGYSYHSKRWSEKIPYYYEDEDFIYGFTLGSIITIYDKKGILDVTGEQLVYQIDYRDLKDGEEYAIFRSKLPHSFLLEEETFELIRKETIITCIENAMAYYSSRHNRIASQYGITYNFSLPVVRNDQWAPFIDDVSMYVVFQGYPFEDIGHVTYHCFSSTGAKLSKKRVYYLEQKDWYLLYHKSNCDQLNKSTNLIIKEESYYSIEECVMKGAYACSLCNTQGVFVPDELVFDKK